MLYVLQNCLLPLQGYLRNTRRRLADGICFSQKYSVDAKSYYLFGRNPEMVDFAIDHVSCSRVHAALVHHKALKRPFLLDLGSSPLRYSDSFRHVVLETDAYWLQHMELLWAIYDWNPTNHNSCSQIHGSILELRRGTILYEKRRSQRSRHRLRKRVKRRTKT